MRVWVLIIRIHVKAGTVAHAYNEGDRDKKISEFRWPASLPNQGGPHSMRDLVSKYKVKKQLMKTPNINH